MQAVIIALRGTHILLGVFWAGTVLFLNTLLGPSLAAAGPAGGRVMLELGQRRFHDVLGVVSTLTILSGAGLLWLDSGGLTRAWVIAPVGMAFCVGALAALAAYLVGLLAIRPLIARMDQLQVELMEARTEALRGSHAARLGLMRQQMMHRSRWTASLLGVAVLAMAVARYL
jgi:hypothetical protein